VVGIDRDLGQAADDLDRVVDARVTTQLNAPALQPAQRPHVERLRPLGRHKRQEADRQLELQRPYTFPGDRLRDRDRKGKLAAIEVSFELAHGTVGSGHANTCSHRFVSGVWTASTATPNAP
jgi:hypothetical protein